MAIEEREIDILKHQIVPEHVILNDEDKKTLLGKFNILPEQLPKIETTDPVVKALGAKAGDVLQINRASPTAGKTVYYRFVIKPIV